MEESWCIIKGVIDSLVEKWVPWKRKRGRRNKPRWMNGEIQKAVKAKKTAWKRWKRSGTEEDKKEYKKWEGKTKKLIRNRKNAFERNVAKESKTNPKLFYSYINSARRNRSPIGPLLSGDELVVNPKAQSDVLNRYFSSVITRCDSESPSNGYRKN